MILKEQLYVVTLAEEGSITEAAEKLYLTQPALSIFLSKLEKSIGKPLFERRNSKLIPTFLGELYLTTARQMLQLAHEYNLQQSLIVDNTLGRIRIGIQTRRSPQIIPLLFDFFHETHPNLKIIFEEGNTNDLENMLLDNKVDLMISSVSNESDTFYYRHLYPERILAVIAPSIWENTLKKSHKDSVDLRDFNDQTFILPHVGQSLRKDMDEILSQKGVSPSKIIEIRSLETIARLAAKGVGLGFIREGYTKSFSLDPALYHPVDHASDFHSNLVLCCHKSTMKSESFQTLIEEIAQALISREWA